MSNNEPDDEVQLQLRHRRVAGGALVAIGLLISATVGSCVSVLSEHATTWDLFLLSAWITVPAIATGLYFLLRR